ncbi:hypothetical protein Fcan01_24183 [Folsomia candida]|uniref:Uncharacterized protein n=1 Tax=Folsomia candida TaxID=158441 RepID=A0A226D762_FOLCA|nr:hypothetical protein Fcan01_24183 [Folsomia candida]
MRKFPLLVYTNWLYLYYFAITLVTKCDTDLNIIKITGSSYQKTKYNTSYCNPIIPAGFVTELETSGECFNIYPQENCTGSFIRTNLRRGSYQEPKTYQWEWEILKKGDLQIGSVGPCFDRCDPRNWGGDQKLEVEVKFNDGVDIPELDLLSKWNLGNNSTKTLAISRCGAFCNKSVPHIHPEVGEMGSGKNVVTFYATKDYSGYYGQPTNVGLNCGCVTLEDDERKYVSIRTYGLCVVLYRYPGHLRVFAPARHIFSRGYY